MTRKLFCFLLAALVCASLAVCVSAADAGAFVYDEAGLLSSGEESALNSCLSSLSQTYGAQILVVTVESAQGNIDYFIEDVYDSMDFGYGSGRDGVLLLICMEDREYRILSNGFAADAISLYDIECISDAIVSDLSYGDYYSAFAEFADQCGYYLEGYVHGFPFEAGQNLLIALAIGLLAGVTVALVLKSQLKSVRPQNKANAYLKTGSMQITQRTDLFLYRNISRVKIQTSSSSHSGSSRNVGGGRF